MSKAFGREMDVRDASDRPLIVGFIISLFVHLLVLMLVPAWTPKMGMDVYSLDQGGIVQLEALRPSTGIGEEPSTSGLPSGRPETAVNPGKRGDEGSGQDRAEDQAVQVEERPASRPAEVKPAEPKPAAARPVAPKLAPKAAAAPSPEPKASGTDKAGVSGVLTSQAGTVAVRTQPQSESSSKTAPEPSAAKPPSEASDAAGSEGGQEASEKTSQVPQAAASSGTAPGAAGDSGPGGGKESAKQGAGGGSSPVAGDAPQQGMSGMSMVISAHKPSYPKNAQNARAKGEVKVLIRVSPSGTPMSVTVVESSGDPRFGFDTYVVRTIEKGWRFATTDSEYEFELTFRFDLDAKEPVTVEDGDVRFISGR